MRWLQCLSLAAALTAAVCAQTIPIAFTHVPAFVAVGKTYKINWAGGDPSLPVTITLREGDPDALKTLATLTSKPAHSLQAQSVLGL